MGAELGEPTFNLPSCLWVLGSQLDPMLPCHPEKRQSGRHHERCLWGQDPRDLTEDTVYTLGLALDLGAFHLESELATRSDLGHVWSCYTSPKTSHRYQDFCLLHKGLLTSLGFSLLLCEIGTRILCSGAAAGVKCIRDERHFLTPRVAGQVLAGQQ